MMFYFPRSDIPVDYYHHRGQHAVKNIPEEAGIAGSLHVHLSLICGILTCTFEQMSSIPNYLVDISHESLFSCVYVYHSQEAHASVDKEQGSIMSKVFISNFATMALIVLIAYGKGE
jgi:hypothetical protein